MVALSRSDRLTGQLSSATLSFPEALFKHRCTGPSCEHPTGAPCPAGGSQAAPVLSPPFKVLLMPSCTWSLPRSHDGMR